MNTHPATTATRHWLKHFVIQLNICPFARKVFEEACIRYRVIESHDWENSLQELTIEWLYLDENPQCITTLAIFPQMLQNFDEYLDFLALAEQLLDDEGYTGIYQLASFHPDYLFADSKHDDPANYTNRSPYPMVHIIREESISEALANFEHAEKIPERNISLLREMGVEQIKKITTMKTP